MRAWDRDVRNISTRVLSISTAPMARMPVYTCSLKNPGIGSLNLRVTGKTIKLRSIPLEDFAFENCWCRMLNNKTTSPLLSRCCHFQVVVVPTNLETSTQTSRYESPYFGSDGQNPSTHSNGPRGIRDKNFTAAEKIWIFQEQGSQRIAEKYAKDCRNFAGGRKTLEGVWERSLCTRF